MLRECQGEGNYRIGRRWGVLCANWNGAARKQEKNARVQGGLNFWTRDRRGMRGLINIVLATINIRSGRAGGLEAALRAKKLTDGIHERQGEGYSVWGTEAESRHRGGIELVWREDAGWQMEGITNFGPNVESLLLTLGSRRWYVLGVYVPPHDAPAIHRIEQALEVASKGM